GSRGTSARTSPRESSGRSTSPWWPPVWSPTASGANVVYILDPGAGGPPLWADPPSGRACVRRARARPSGSGRRPGRLDRVDDLLRVGAGEPVHHPGPEGPRTDLARHEVGRVEPVHGVGVCQVLSGELVDRRRAVFRVETVVGADPVALGRGERFRVGPVRTREVGLEGLHLGAVGEGRDELAAAEDRL